jgi:hypothetical protein
MAHSSTPTRYGHRREQDLAPKGATQVDRRFAQPVSHRSPTASRVILRNKLSVVSAVLILVGGYVHFCLYRHGYRFIPKIGVSFLLQFSSSAILAGALLVVVRPMRLGRLFVDLAQLARLAAIGLSVGTLAALGIAHTGGGLFSFHEIGLRPAPQTLIAIVVESLATVLLAIAMLQARTAARRQDLGARMVHPSRASMRDAA